MLGSLELIVASVAASQNILSGIAASATAVINAELYVGDGRQRLDKVIESIMGDSEKENIAFEDKNATSQTVSHQKLSLQSKRLRRVLQAKIQEYPEDCIEHQFIKTILSAASKLKEMSSSHQSASAAIKSIRKNLQDLEEFDSSLMAGQLNSSICQILAMLTGAPGILITVGVTAVQAGTVAAGKLYLGKQLVAAEEKGMQLIEKTHSFYKKISLDVIDNEYNTARSPVMQNYLIKLKAYVLKENNPDKILAAIDDLNILKRDYLGKDSLQIQKDMTRRIKLIKQNMAPRTQGGYRNSVFDSNHLDLSRCDRLEIEKARFEVLKAEVSILEGIVDPSKKLGSLLISSGSFATSSRVSKRKQQQERLAASGGHDVSSPKPSTRVTESSQSKRMELQALAM